MAKVTIKDIRTGKVILVDGFAVELDTDAEMRAIINEVAAEAGYNPKNLLITIERTEKVWRSSHGI